MDIEYTTDYYDDYCDEDYYDNYEDNDYYDYNYYCDNRDSYDNKDKPSFLSHKIDGEPRNNVTKGLKRNHHKSNGQNKRNKKHKLQLL